MKGRIYVSGASGSGVSTLGAALGERLCLPHFDVDDFYWYPTNPPFEQSRPPEERLVLLKQTLQSRWVLSGSLDGWGGEVIQDADLVVFVDTPTALRLERLKAREFQRFGPRILPGGDMHENHEKFLVWAASYDDGSRQGRNRPRHERWLAQLSTPIVRVNGENSVAELVTSVMTAISALPTRESAGD